MRHRVGRRQGFIMQVAGADGLAEQADDLVDRSDERDVDEAALNLRPIVARLAPKARSILLE
ncbi:hypothetical protein [Rhodoblastus sp.]|uniref:hypothetical protein n=1 Tax=Rhodoblastus sp. TaxID=1962975 RepID=UPI0025E1C036|nr:hypothetical protein [Rhodoblastus sp.]